MLAALDLAHVDDHTLERCVHEELEKPKRLAMPSTFAQVLANTIIARMETGASIPRIYPREWKRSDLRLEFGQSFFEVICSIPEVVFLSKGGPIVVDGSSGDRVSVAKE